MSLISDTNKCLLLEQALIAFGCVMRTTSNQGIGDKVDMDSFRGLTTDEASAPVSVPGAY